MIILFENELKKVKGNKNTVTVPKGFWSLIVAILEKIRFTL